MIRKLESTPNDDLSAPKRESKSPGWMKTQLITQDRIQIWVRPLDGVRLLLLLFLIYYFTKADSDCSKMANFR